MQLFTLCSNLWLPRHGCGPRLTALPQFLEGSTVLLWASYLSPRLRAPELLRFMCYSCSSLFEATPPAAYTVRGESSMQSLFQGQVLRNFVFLSCCFAAVHMQAAITSCTGKPAPLLLFLCLGWLNAAHWRNRPVYLPYAGGLGC